MPLRERTSHGGTTTSDVYYTYDRSRLTASQLPSDEFAVSPPTTISSQRDSTLPANIAPVAPSGDLTDPAEPAESIAFRQQFGLRADTAYVSSVVGDPTLAASADAFGVPLTSTELADLNQRITVQDALQPIDDYAAKYPADYAGLYIDQTQGGLVYVGWTQNAASHMQDLQSLFAYPSRLRSFSPLRTAAQLDTLNSQVTQDWLGGKLDSYNIQLVGEDLRNNNVVATSPSPTAAQQLALVATYGPGVRLDSGSAHTDTDGHNGFDNSIPPLEAGIHIYDEHDNANCSSGFATYRDTSSRGRNMRAYYQLTAGHCVPYTGSDAYGIRFKHHGVDVGPTRQSTLQNGRGKNAREDALNIRIKASFRTNQIYYRVEHQNGDHYRSITGLDHRAHTGAMICKAGAYSVYVHCGALTAESSSLKYDNGSTVSPLFVVDFNGRCDEKAGDSGGPVFHDNIADGLTTGGVSGSNCNAPYGAKVLYSPIDATLNDLGLRLLTG